jgi:hypothetical protein
MSKQALATAAVILVLAAAWFALVCLFWKIGSDISRVVLAAAMAAIVAAALLLNMRRKRRERERAKEALCELATHLGLTYDGGQRRIDLLGSEGDEIARVAGTYRGRALAVCIAEAKIGAGSEVRVYCYLLIRLSVNNRAKGLLRLEYDRWPSLKLRSCQIGDRAFERKIAIAETRPPDFAASVLASRLLRQRLRAIRPTYLNLRGRTISVSDDQLEFAECNTESPFSGLGTLVRDVESLQPPIELLIDLAEAVEQVEGGSIRAGQPSTAPEHAGRTPISKQLSLL